MILMMVLCIGGCVASDAGNYAKQGNLITVQVKNHASKGARQVRLQVINDKIIRVEATAEDAFPQKTSLIIVPQKPYSRFSVHEDGEQVVVVTSSVKAVVDARDGRVAFYDATGRRMLSEALQGGKTFLPFTVPDREIGVDAKKVSGSQKRGWTWRALFDSPDDEAFYGLGQHQAEEINMKGKNEDLFQYNTKVSVPFVISNKNYGILWDSYSYCRWGNPNDYQQLNRAFRLYDRRGKEGHLTGIYVDREGKRLVRDEDSIYYEFGCPETSEIARRTEPGGIKNLPKGFNLDGSHVVYEGFLEAPTTATYHLSCTMQGI